MNFKRLKQLNNLYYTLALIPAWHSLLSRIPSYSEEDLAALEMIDEHFQRIASEYQKNFAWKDEQSNREQIKEFRSEFDNDFIKERRLEYLKDSIDRIAKRLGRIWVEWNEDGFDREKPRWWRLAILELKHPEILKKVLKKYSMEVYLLKNDVKSKNRVTPEQISKAMRFPLADLIKINGAGFASCPFHSEKTPSFYTRNNWGFCFGCNWRGSVIDFVMQTRDLNFVQSVLALQ